MKELCAVKRTLYSVGSAKKPDFPPNKPLEETKAREEQEQEERVKELCAVKRTPYSGGSAKKPDLQPKKPLQKRKGREEQEQKEGVKEFVQ